LKRIFNQISTNKYDFSTNFANEDGEIHCLHLFRQRGWRNPLCQAYFANPNNKMLTVLPTPMAKCTPSCHVDRFADRAGEMLTKTDPTQYVSKWTLIGK